MIDKAAWRAIRTFSREAVARNLDLFIEGMRHVPTDGPVILASRHYHHLYDGCAILTAIPRQVQILVGLDWIERPVALKAMQAACRSAGWPVVFRNIHEVDRSVWLPALRGALVESAEILRDGRVLLVFPEGYPTIDPRGSPKAEDDEILPFETGVAHIALNAWRSGTPAAVIPVGLHYRLGERWTVILRFGEAVEQASATQPADLAAKLHQNVAELSRA